MEILLEQPGSTPLLQADCWVFCACIPNVQHWSLQARLCLGQFVYEESGLLDRTHLRWFTPATMTSLFEDNGFQIRSVAPRIFRHPAEAVVLEQIRQFAERLGGAPAQAEKDARPPPACDQSGAGLRSSTEEQLPEPAQNAGVALDRGRALLRVQ
jgi:hypothetical protein